MKASSSHSGSQCAYRSWIFLWFRAVLEQIRRSEVFIWQAITFFSLPTYEKTTALEWCPHEMPNGLGPDSEHQRDEAQFWVLLLRHTFYFEYCVIAFPLWIWMFSVTFTLLMCFLCVKWQRHIPCKCLSSTNQESDIYLVCPASPISMTWLESLWLSAFCFVLVFFQWNGLKVQVCVCVFICFLISSRSLEAVIWFIETFFSFLLFSFSFLNTQILFQPLLYISLSLNILIWHIR